MYLVNKKLLDLKIKGGIIKLSHGIKIPKT